MKSDRTDPRRGANPAGDPVYRTALAPGPTLVDESRLTARGLLATTARDRQGDVLLVDGLDLSHHRRNPVVLLDHGQHHALPVGVTADRDTGEYTVEVDVGAGEVWQTTHFSQKSQVAEQVFALVAEGILRGNSIGFRPVEYDELPPDPDAGLPPKGPGQRPYMIVHKSELIEASWCAIPVNPEAARSACSRDWVGKSLAAPIRKALTPYLSLPGGSRRWHRAADLTPLGLSRHDAPYYFAAGAAVRKSAMHEDDELDELNKALAAEEEGEEPIADEVDELDKSLDAPDDAGDVDDLDKAFDAADDEAPVDEAPAATPYGAKCLQEMHKHLCRAYRYGEKAMPELEHAGVSRHLDKCMKALDGMTGDTETLHQKCYGAKGHAALDRDAVYKSLDEEEAGYEQKAFDAPADEAPVDDLDEKAMSWNDQSAGGSLVGGSPDLGEGENAPLKSSVEGGQWREAPLALAEREEQKSLLAAYKRLKALNDANEARLRRLGL